MGDLVGTCPKDFWKEWIAEGDAAGEPETGTEYGWYTGEAKIDEIRPGDRLYVVAHGRLRGYAPVTRVEPGAIFRRGGAVAVTIDETIRGFPRLRRRWWPRSAERPFPGWQEVGVRMRRAPSTKGKQRELFPLEGRSSVEDRMNG